MRVFKYRHFAKFADKQRISDTDLLEAVQRAEQGLIDADLGGGVIKQRVARKGQGKSGGYRSIILFKSGDRAFFVHGFAKSSQANISHQELIEFKRLASALLKFTNAEISTILKNKTFQEID